MTFAAPEILTKVSLYDRACNEQVTKFKLVFGDGFETPVYNLPLPDDGRTPIHITFPPRTVSWVEVHIVEAILPGVNNPGFGEIVLNDGSVTVP